MSTIQCPDPECRTAGVHYYRTADGVSTVHACRCQDLASGAHLDGITYGGIVASPCHAPHPDAKPARPGFCRHGHDKTVVGADRHGYCRECRRQSDRARRLAS